MPNTAQVTQGTAFYRGDNASPIVYTLIGQVRNISGPDGQRGEIDITTFESTAKEFEKQLPDYGRYTLEVVFDSDNSQHQNLWADFKNGTTRTWRLNIPTSPNKTIVFSGWVQQFSMNEQTDDVYRASVGIRITSAPVASWE